MAFTAEDTGLRDKEYLKFVGAGTGSQMYVAVSIQSGLAITIGSVSATVDSVYIQSGANIDLGSAWTNIGSVLVSNGSLNVYGTTAGSEVYVKAGSISTYGVGSTWFGGGIGSVTITNSLSAIGSYTNYAGSESWIKGGSLFLYSGATSYTDVIQTTIPWTISGVVNIGIGSVNIATTVVPVSGTLIGISGVVYPGANQVWGVSGNAVGVSGIVNQGTTPWTTSGTSTVAGSVYSTGSINIAGFTGSIVAYPGQTPWPIKPTSNTVIGSHYILSGTASLLWSPAAGSKYVITDLIMSADSAMYVRLFESGATQDFIRGYFAANGGMVSNFNTGIKGASAGSQVYVGQSANGSLFITITGYSEA